MQSGNDIKSPKNHDGDIELSAAEILQTVTNVAAKAFFINNTAYFTEPNLNSDYTQFIRDLVTGHRVLVKGQSFFNSSEYAQATANGVTRDEYKNLMPYVKAFMFRLFSEDKIIDENSQSEIKLAIEQFVANWDQCTLGLFVSGATNNFVAHGQSPVTGEHVIDIDMDNTNQINIAAINYHIYSKFSKEIKGRPYDDHDDIYGVINTEMGSDRTGIFLKKTIISNQLLATVSLTEEFPVSKETKEQALYVEIEALKKAIAASTEIERNKIARRILAVINTARNEPSKNPDRMLWLADVVVLIRRSLQHPKDKLSLLALTNLINGPQKEDKNTQWLKNLSWARDLKEEIRLFQFYTECPRLNDPNLSFIDYLQLPVVLKTIKENIGDHATNIISDKGISRYLNDLPRYQRIYANFYSILEKANGIRDESWEDFYKDYDTLFLSDTFTTSNKTYDDLLSFLELTYPQIVTSLRDLRNSYIEFARTDLLDANGNIKEEIDTFFKKHSAFYKNLPESEESQKNKNHQFITTYFITVGSEISSGLRVIGLEEAEKNRERSGSISKTIGFFCRYHQQIPFIDSMIESIKHPDLHPANKIVEPTSLLWGLEELGYVKNPFIKFLASELAQEKMRSMDVQKANEDIEKNGITSFMAPLFEGIEITDDFNREVLNPLFEQLMAALKESIRQIKQQTNITDDEVIQFVLENADMMKETAFISWAKKTTLHIVENIFDEEEKLFPYVKLALSAMPKELRSKYLDLNNETVAAGVLSAFQTRIDTEFKQRIERMFPEKEVHAQNEKKRSIINSDDTRSKFNSFSEFSRESFKLITNENIRNKTLTQSLKKSIQNLRNENKGQATLGEYLEIEKVKENLNKNITLIEDTQSIINDLFSELPYHLRFKSIVDVVYENFNSKLNVGQVEENEKELILEVVAKEEKNDPISILQSEPSENTFMMAELLGFIINDLFDENANIKSDIYNKLNKEGKLENILSDNIKNKEKLEVERKHTIILAYVNFIMELLLQKIFLSDQNNVDVDALHGVDSLRARGDRFTQHFINYATAQLQQVPLKDKDTLEFYQSRGNFAKAIRTKHNDNNFLLNNIIDKAMLTEIDKSAIDLTKPIPIKELTKGLRVATQTVNHPNQNNIKACVECAEQFSKWNKKKLACAFGGLAALAIIAVGVTAIFASCGMLSLPGLLTVGLGVKLLAASVVGITATVVAAPVALTYSQTFFASAKHEKQAKAPIAEELKKSNKPTS